MCHNACNKHPNGCTNVCETRKCAGEQVMARDSTHLQHTPAPTNAQRDKARTARVTAMLAAKIWLARRPCVVKILLQPLVFSQNMPFAAALSFCTPYFTQLIHFTGGHSAIHDFRLNQNVSTNVLQSSRILHHCAPNFTVSHFGKVRQKHEVCMLCSKGIYAKIIF